MVRSGSSNLIFLSEDGGFDDGDGIGRGSVVTSHLSMELTNSSIKRNISELFVHVVVSSSGLISKDNAEGLDMIGSFFKDFVDSQDLSLGSFGFELTTEMVPEFCFGDNFVGCKESDGIYFRVGV